MLCYVVVVFYYPTSFHRHEDQVDLLVSVFAMHDLSEIILDRYDVDPVRLGVSDDMVISSCC